MTPETQQAIEAVKAANKSFYLRALSFSQEFVKTLMKSFSSEDLKDEFYRVNKEKAAEPRVWGAVISELKKSGLIVFHEYQKYSASQGHGRPSAVWLSKAYSAKQSANASMKGRVNATQAESGQISLI